VNSSQYVPMIDDLLWVGDGATPGTDGVRSLTSRSRVKAIRGLIRSCDVGVRLHNRVTCHNRERVGHRIDGMIA
jgi:hypothetical protein